MTNRHPCSLVYMMGRVGFREKRFMDVLVKVGDRKHYEGDSGTFSFDRLLFFFLNCMIVILWKTGFVY